MGEKKDLHEGLNSLGNSAEANKGLYLYEKPNPAILEKFPNPADGCEIGLHIEVPEFTSLCPKTGQPDFAKILIDYDPDKHCVESKSLKLYLMGYRNFGEFHEACVNRICKDLVELLDPKYMSVKGEFSARGGIPFWPTAVYRRPYAGDNEG